MRTVKRRRPCILPLHNCTPLAMFILDENIPPVVHLSLASFDSASALMRSNGRRCRFEANKARAADNFAPAFSNAGPLQELACSMDSRNSRMGVGVARGRNDVRQAQKGEP